jgi:hypothetical protein
MVSIQKRSDKIRDSWTLSAQRDKYLLDGDAIHFTELWLKLNPLKKMGVYK